MSALGLGRVKTPWRKASTPADRGAVAGLCDFLEVLGFSVLESILIGIPGVLGSFETRIGTRVCG
jgi:hypothetical protein